MTVWVFVIWCDGENGFVASLDDMVQALPQAIMRLVDPEVRRRMGVCARSTAIEYSWEHTTNMVEEILAAHCGQ